MKVVLDTNVLVAAMIARGVCADLFERVIADHQLILSPHILGEFERVMTSKFKFDEARVERALTLFLRVGHIVTPEPLAEPVCRDKDDDAVLALAQSSGADCLVTGDGDLLILESFTRIPIISPRAFLTFKLL
ncbi:MAG: putative toxin-antitoxin system toxin component, PIN family [Acidobacteria bacterium]|nr:MAG: putative toxin-antitoxin system toxin component, PIN family [Acidobacteriota bacterium]